MVASLETITLAEIISFWDDVFFTLGQGLEPEKIQYGKDGAVVFLPVPRSGSHICPVPRRQQRTRPLVRPRYLGRPGT